MEKSLAEMIDALYAGAATSRAAFVQDNLDGEGPFIAGWNAEMIGSPQPTKSDVEAAYLAQHPDD